MRFKILFFIFFQMFAAPKVIQTLPKESKKYYKKSEKVYNNYLVAYSNALKKQNIEDMKALVPQINASIRDDMKKFVESIDLKNSKDGTLENIQNALAKNKYDKINDDLLKKIKQCFENWQEGRVRVTDDEHRSKINAIIREITDELFKDFFNSISKMLEDFNDEILSKCHKEEILAQYHNLRTDHNIIGITEFELKKQDFDKDGDFISSYALKKVCIFDGFSYLEKNGEQYEANLDKRILLFQVNLITTEGEKKFITRFLKEVFESETRNINQDFLKQIFETLNSEFEAIEEKKLFKFLSQDNIIKFLFEIVYQANEIEKDLELNLQNALGQQIPLKDLPTKYKTISTGDFEEVIRANEFVLKMQFNLGEDCAIIQIYQERATFQFLNALEYAKQASKNSFSIIVNKGGVHFVAAKVLLKNGEATDLIIVDSYDHCPEIKIFSEALKALNKNVKVHRIGLNVQANNDCLYYTCMSIYFLHEILNSDSKFLKKKTLEEKLKIFKEIGSFLFHTDNLDILYKFFPYLDDFDSEIKKNILNHSKRMYKMWPVYWQDPSSKFPKFPKFNFDEFYFNFKKEKKAVDLKNFFEKEQYVRNLIIQECSKEEKMIVQKFIKEGKNILDLDRKNFFENEQYVRNLIIQEFLKEEKNILQFIEDLEKYIYNYYLNWHWPNFYTFYIYIIWRFSEFSDIEFAEFEDCKIVDTNAVSFDFFN